MRSFSTAGLFLAIVLAASPAFAQEEALTATAAIESALAITVPAAAVDDAVIIPANLRKPGGTGRNVLTMLNVGVAGLQAFDVYSTSTLLKKGAVEANPMMKGLTKSPAGFIAVKTGIAVTTIYVAERLWKQNRRAAAIALVALSNVGLGFAAVNNTSVMRQMR